MNLPQKYRDYRDSISDLSSSLERLDPDQQNSREMLERILRCGEQFREVLATAGSNTKKLPSERCAIEQLLEQIEQESIHRRIEQDQKACVGELVDQLAACEYRHPISKIKIVGEDVRLQAYNFCRASLDDPERCRLICGEANLKLGILAHWRALNSEKAKCLSLAWPLEFEPLTELLHLLDEIILPDGKESLNESQKRLPNTKPESCAGLQPSIDFAIDSEAESVVGINQKTSQEIDRRKEGAKKRAQFRRLLSSSQPDSLDSLGLLDNRTTNRTILPDVQIDTGSDTTGLPVRAEELSTAEELPPVVEINIRETDTTEAADQLSNNAITESSFGVSHSEMLVDEFEEVYDSDEACDHHTDDIVEHRLSTPELCEPSVELPTKGDGGSQKSDQRNNGFEDADIDVVAWRAIAVSRFSLAYCILTAAGKILGASSSCMLPETASVALLSSLVQSNSTDIAEQLKKDFSLLQDHLNSTTVESAWPQRLLVTSSSLRPALIAPMTDAFLMLSDSFLPVDQLPAYTEVCRAVFKYGSFRLEIDPMVLTGVREQAEWQDQLNVQIKALESWWQSEKCANVIYAHTTNVWHHWLRDDELIGKQIAVIREAGLAKDPAKAIPLIDRFAHEWSDEREIDRRCRVTDEEKRGRGANRRPIDGRALQALRQKVRILNGLLTSLKQKIHSRPDSTNDFGHAKVINCRTSVLASIDQAIIEVRDDLAERARSPDVYAAAQIAERHLHEIKRMFTQPRRGEYPTEHVVDLLTSDLALVPGISTDFWMVDNRTEFDALDLQKLIKAAEEPLSEEDAFSIQTDRANHAASERLLLKLENEHGSTSLVEQLRQKRLEALERDRIRLRNDAYRTEQEIDKAVCYDLVNESVRQNFVAEVTSIQSSIETETNLSTLFVDIERINAELTRLREVRLEEVRERLSRLREGSGTIEEDDLERIENTLRQRDFATADEYISLVRNGERLDSAARNADGNFINFSEEFLPLIEAYLDLHSSEQPSDWCSQLREGKPEVFSVAFETLNHREAAILLLEKWRMLLRVRRPEEKRTLHLQGFFSALGFGEVRAESIRRGEQWTLDLVSGPVLANAKICSIPQFGSNASGRYQVLSIDGRASDSDIEKCVSDITRDRQGSETPLIVLYCGRLNQRRRRKVAGECWGKYLLLLIDELLVMYIASKTEGLQQTFFQCTLPYTFAQPYSITASFVPIEMFFGRREEYAAIISRDGTNLVFGGRQLGKSVLLREAERREHNPKKGRVVRWIDLKNRGIGTQYPPSELWSVIAECLLEEKIVDRAISQYSTIRSRIIDWLSDDQDRRIIFLLDEADEFFNQDSQQIDEASRSGFPIVSQLKGLMDDTNRRFKVVFAGLHNVQRAAKDSNTPIAHLGTPTNIGPMLDNGEWKQARALIELPMSQMGFVFSSDDLVTRILSHTNFYPSLIQIFCRHLLLSLQKRPHNVVNFRSGPPHEIRMEDIERVYQSADLQAEIRSRFELTLNLDERYRLIALLIALQTIEMREDGEPIRGLTLREIHKQSMGFWSDGFAQDSSFDGFEILLDEMVGLGVLRRDPDGRYALRSANVLNLMGSKERIEARLLDVANSPQPSEYKASTFRRSLSENAVRRSPLTSQQEGRLLSRTNSVTLLSGCRLALMSDLHEALNSLNKSDVHILHYTKRSSCEEFLTWLDSEHRRNEGLTIVVVAIDSGWNEDWVKSTESFLKRRHSATKNFIRVVFVADPPKLWNLALEDTLLSRIDRFQLHPWSHSILDRWLDDNSFNREKDRVSQLHEASGGWGALIQAIADVCGDQKHLWLEKLSEQSERWPKDALAHDLLQLPVDPENFLKRWAEFGPEAQFCIEDLSTLAGDVSIEKLIGWASELFYIESSEDGEWKMNPFVARILQAAP